VDNAPQILEGDQMALADWLGLGGQPENFTDWNSARNFVFDVIVNNPRISPQEKIDLQKLEEQAYKENTGKWFLSEREEIARYYNYLFNNAKTYTKDQRLLNVFAVANGTAIDVADPNKVAGIDTTKQAQTVSGFVAVFALVGLYVFLKK
jgi:hypothetical protein